VDAQGFRAAVVVDGQVRGETPPKPWSKTSGRTSQWCSIRPDRVLTSYIDGARAGQATNVNVTPAQLLPASVDDQPALLRTRAG
jgi:hypothetical protein